MGEYRTHQPMQDLFAS